MFIGHLKKKRSVEGYLRNNCLEPRSIFQRHEDLAKEMISRGYNHKSPMKEEDCSVILDLPIECQYWEINRVKNELDLLKRCLGCYARFYDISLQNMPGKTSM
jgi:hypothetical protein